MDGAINKVISYYYAFLSGNIVHSICYPAIYYLQILTQIGLLFKLNTAEYVSKLPENKYPQKMSTTM